MTTTRDQTISSRIILKRPPFQKLTVNLVPRAPTRIARIWTFDLDREKQKWTVIRGEGNRNRKHTQEMSNSVM